MRLVLSRWCEALSFLLVCIVTPEHCRHVYLTKWFHQSEHKHRYLEENMMSTPCVFIAIHIKLAAIDFWVEFIPTPTVTASTVTNVNPLLWIIKFDQKAVGYLFHRHAVVVSAGSSCHKIHCWVMALNSLEHLPPARWGLASASLFFFCILSRIMEISVIGFYNLI